MNKKNSQEGIVQIIVLFIIFSMIVWYFKFDVRGFVDSHPQIKTAFTDAINYLRSIWNNYLSGAWSFIWNKVVVDIIWKNGLQPLFLFLSSHIPGKIS